MTIFDTFLEIKTPEELYKYMNENIEYGFYGSDNKIHKDIDEDFGDYFPFKYYLMTPEEVLKYRVGMCWEQAELEREWFKKHNIKHKVFFHMICLDHPNNYSTHTFLAYEMNSKWYWFENSWFDQKGIHEYDSLEELLKAEKEADYELLKTQGITEEEFSHYEIKEIKRPLFHIKALDYISFCMDEEIKSDN